MIQLDPQQKKAVLYKGGPLLVAAGPGSGKTRTLCERVIHLMNNKVHPSNILAVTFTNKAAGEMKKRILKSVGSQRKEIPFIGTIHSLCLDILSNELDEKFFIIDEVHKEEIVRIIKNKLKDRNHSVRDLISLISKKKSISTTSLPPEEEKFFHLYNQYLRSLQAFDYDDLLLYTLNILKQEDTAHAYQQKFHHVLIDEYQDISPLQSKILSILAEPQNNIFAIGDVDQSIYRFRGADPNLFLTFTKRFPNANTLYLQKNYRSSRNIVKNATHVIQNNTQRLPLDARSTICEDIPVYVVSCPTEGEEAKYIIAEIEKQVGGTSFTDYDSGSSHMQENVQFGDFAVLYRNNSFAKVIEKECIHRGIPYQIIGKNPFWKREEVQSILMILKSLLDPSFRSHPFVVSLHIDYSSPIKTTQDVQALISESGILETSKDDEQAQRNIEILLSMIDEYRDKEPRDIISHLALLAREMYIDERANCVQLMTMHQSKGLEFDTVFIAGCEEGYIPSLKEEFLNEIEEERRLLYVGMTRAMKRLYLTHALARTIWGRREQRTPSRFLSEFDIDTIEKIQLQTRRRRRKEQMKLC